MMNRAREILTTLSGAASVTFLLIGLLANAQPVHAGAPPITPECATSPTGPGSTVPGANAARVNPECIGCFCGGTCGANQIACVGTCTGWACTCTCGICNDWLTGLNYCACA